MKLKSILKKTTALMLTVTMLGSLTACSKKEPNEKITDISLETDVTLNLWYTDSKMTSYFEMAAAKYHEANQHVTVVLKQMSTDDYLENIYNGSIKEGNVADIYVSSSDHLEKAYLMGLTSVNDKHTGNYTAQNYGNTAIKSITYGGKLYGYPLTFDTAVMVYNKKYSKPLNTFSAITEFYNAYVHTEENEEVEVVVEWDISDSFLNYALVGSYANVGGESAENAALIELDSNNIKASMSELINLKNEYGIDRNKITRQKCLESFMSNKLLYTIVKASDIPKISASGVDFGIIKIPDLNSNLKTNAMSTTTMLLVNPYSANINVAKSVANAFSYEYASEFESLTSTVSARANLESYSNEEYKNLYNIYSGTVVKAKFMSIGDFYLRYEILLHQVWDQPDGMTVEDAYANFSAFATRQLGAKLK